MIEQMLIDAVKNYISERIDEEIKSKTNEFYNTLVARKDKYIVEIMSGIRMYHESNPENMYMDYRIMFINKYKVTQKREDE